MSEILTFKTSRRKDAEQFLNKLMRLIIVLLFLFLAADLLFHYLIAPKLRIKNIIVKSDIPLSRQEVLTIAGIDGKEDYFSLKGDVIKNNLEAYPLVREARVEKVFPDTLRLDIKGRRALFISLADTGKGSFPVAIDEEGVIFQSGSSIKEWDLPLISGLKFNELELGATLPRMLDSLFAEVTQMRTAYPDLFRLISEIQIVPLSPASFELLLYPLSFTVRVRLAGSIDGTVLKNALLVLDLLKREGISEKVKEIDFRTGEVVYRIKEG